jgi:SAM-dependent methyltransferase
MKSSADPLVDELRRSGYSSPGFAARFDANRPRPPAILVELLCFIAHAERPALVVDRGSGTGLSTRVWAERAESVVGVEPNPEMRAYAELITRDENVRYLDAAAEATGLPDACADIVTSAQALAWMDPDRIFGEIGRILRPGGVFAAYDYRSLLTGSWELDERFGEVRAAVGRLREELGLERGKRRWPVSGERLVASGQFRNTNETSVHSVEVGTPERLVNFLLSEGSVTTLLERVSEEAIGLDRLRAVAARTPGNDPAPWYIGYGVWLGLK